MFSDFFDENVMFAPMIDARRMEVYAGVYNYALTPLKSPAPLILEENSYKEFLDAALSYFSATVRKKRVLFFNNIPTPIS